jgi:hypothetical protein
MQYFINTSIASTINIIICCYVSNLKSMSWELIVSQFTTGEDKSIVGDQTSIYGRFR